MVANARSRGAAGQKFGTRGEKLLQYVLLPRWFMVQLIHVEVCRDLQQEFAVLLLGLLWHVWDGIPIDTSKIVGVGVGVGVAVGVVPLIGWPPLGRSIVDKVWGGGAQSLDTDLQRPFYSVATVGRERRWPRWIKKGVAYRYQATVVCVCVCVCVCVGGGGGGGGGGMWSPLSLESEKTAFEGSNGLCFSYRTRKQVTLAFSAVPWDWTSLGGLSFLWSSAINSLSKFTTYPASCLPLDHLYTLNLFLCVGVPNSTAILHIWCCTRAEHAVDLMALEDTWTFLLSTALVE